MSKKWIKASITTSLIMGLGLNLSLIVLNNQNHLDLNVSTNDRFNEERRIDKIDLRQASSSEGALNSKIFVQHAQNAVGQYFLRFATAVSGDLTSINYDFDILDTDGLDFENYSVSTVYSALASNEDEVYYDGSKLVYEKSDATLNWYWATFVVEFGLESPYLDSEFKININVNGSDVAERQTSLPEVIELATENAIDVYFIAGQSNAGGCSDYYRSDKKTPNISFKNQKKMEEHIAGYDNVLYYGSALGQTGSGTVVSKLTPTKVGFGCSSGREIGPELGMAEYLSERYAGTNRKALIIKYAAVSSGIVTDTGCEFGEWSAPSYPNPGLGTQQNLFDNMMGNSNDGYESGVVYKALKLVKDAGYNKVNYKGFFWSQGCGDQNNHTYYGEALEALKGDFRTRINEVSNTLASQFENFNFTDASKLPFLISEMCVTGYNATRNEDNTSSSANINAIINHQRTVAANDVNAESLKTYMYDIVKNATGYQSTINDGVSYCADEWHYNGDDMLDGGRRAASILYTFKVDEGMCQHQFGEFIITENEHTQVCDLCHDYVKDEHNYIHSSDGQYHYEECEVCKNVINKEEHSITSIEVVSTKEYSYRDELDETAFEVYSSCECGYEGAKIEDYDVSFNSTTADVNTTATITAGGVETTISLNVKTPFGRQIEYNAENGLTDDYASKLVNRQIVIKDSSIKAYTGTSTVGGAPRNNELAILKHMTSDGKYIYALINSNANVNATYGYNLGVIVKIDTDGNVIDYTKNCYYWGTTGVKIAHFNGKLIVYATVDGATAYSGNAKSFIGKVLVFDAETLALEDEDYSLTSMFDKHPESYLKISDFVTTEDGSKAAVIYVINENGVNNRYLYTYEMGDDGQYHYVASALLGNTGYQGIYATNDYIYFNINNSTTRLITFVVYNWTLENIGQISSESGLDVTDESKYYKYNSNVISSSTSYVRDQSYPYGCVEIDGVIYYGRACWKDGGSAVSSTKPYKGTYIYRIDLK